MLPQTRTVDKYFDLTDSFIAVRVLDGDFYPLQGREDRPLNLREYRRLVIHACVVNLESVLPRTVQASAEGVTGAEYQLYQICVDVNPQLEIHTVSLPVTAGEEAPAARPPDRRVTRRVAGLERRLAGAIVGQDGAIGQICRAVRKAACGLKDPNRPVGSFLLVGRTGCGKTELAKALARCWGGPLVRVDCSEFALSHETAKLVGAPPGYVGFHEGGALTEALLRHPQSVVLFDEVEKGHGNLHNMLLQILDEGRLTDNKGRTVSFRECVVLLTSNVGTEDYSKAAQCVGFERSGPLPAGEYDAITQAALRRAFKPEFLNRLDGVLVFKQLSRKDCARIAELQFRSLRSRAQGADIVLRWSRELPGALAELGYSEEFGAREVRRTVDRLVGEPFASDVLEGRFRSGDAVRASWLDGAVDLALARQRTKQAPGQRTKQAPAREAGADSTHPPG